MIRSAHHDVPAYKTLDGSLVRELMHPDVRGNRAQSLTEATVRPCEPGVSLLLQPGLPS